MYVGVHHATVLPRWVREVTALPNGLSCKVRSRCQTLCSAVRPYAVDLCYVVRRRVVRS